MGLVALVFGTSSALLLRFFSTSLVLLWPFFFTFLALLWYFLDTFWHFLFTSLLLHKTIVTVLRESVCPACWILKTIGYFNRAVF